MRDLALGALYTAGTPGSQPPIKQSHERTRGRAGSPHSHDGHASALRTHTAHGDQTRTNHHQLKASTVGQPDRRLHSSHSHTTSENRPPSQQITDTPIPHPPITSHHGGDGDGVHPLALPRAPARSPPPLRYP